VAAAIYCRISRDRTGAGLGVDRQEKDCRALAERLGLPVDAVLVDNDLSAYSGKKRPAYERLLEGVRAGRYSAVIAWHPDRLHRSPVELERFIDVIEAAQVQVHTVTAGDVDLTTASGRMTARIVGAVARHESEHRSERIKRKHLELAERGLPSGGARPDRPRNAGLRERHDKVFGPAAWPAIVPKDVWMACHSRLVDPSRRTSFSNARAYLLTGLAVCGKCGATVRGTSRAGGALIYKCRNACLSRGMAPVDRMISAAVVTLLSDPSARKLFVQPKTGRDYTGEMTVLRSRMKDAAKLSLDRKRAVIAKLLIITILPTRKGSRFDPASIRLEPR
jgi:site-specific DNA recombinase